MSKTFPKAFTFLAVAALVATASAGARDSRTITIGHSATVENGTLAAGNYIISWKSRSPEAGVTFQSAKDQGVVMTAHGRIEKRSDYFDRDMVVYDETPDGSRRLLELRFAGTRDREHEGVSEERRRILLFCHERLKNGAYPMQRYYAS